MPDDFDRYKEFNTWVFEHFFKDYVEIVPWENNPGGVYPYSKPNLHEVFADISDVEKNENFGCACETLGRIDWNGFLEDQENLDIPRWLGLVAIQVFVAKETTQNGDYHKTLAKRLGINVNDLKKKAELQEYIYLNFINWCTTKGIDSIICDPNAHLQNVDDLQMRRYLALSRDDSEWPKQIAGGIDPTKIAKKNRSNKGVDYQAYYENNKGQGPFQARSTEPDRGRFVSERPASEKMPISPKVCNSVVFEGSGWIVVESHGSISRFKPYKLGGDGDLSVRKICGLDFSALENFTRTARKWIESARVDFLPGTVNKNIVPIALRKEYKM